MNTPTGRILAVPAALTGLYFWSIMPRITGKPDPAPMHTKFYAHRGLYENGSDAPENSMAAFKKAVDAGFGIELDVQLTRDRIPVIFHDFDLVRACGVPGMVCDFSFEELSQFRLFGSSERIPALRDFLEMVDGRVPLIVEYKSEDRNMDVCRIVDIAGELQSRSRKGKFLPVQFHGTHVDKCTVIIFRVGTEAVKGHFHVIALNSLGINGVYTSIIERFCERKLYSQT